MKAGSHGWRGPGSGAAELNKLPDSRVKFFDEAFILTSKATGKPLANVNYRVKFASGDYAYGTTDESGQTDLVTTESSEPLVIEVEA